mmetsp:Transcript_43489/g.111222  ORF Transcript_43489/g.111222 Transcript_43489/m.111222 type:complete len:159 (-) Transcript_43489:110-586(-)|eukprot:jgi/Tetstr1/465253/TSEL_009955.t1
MVRADQPLLVLEALEGPCTGQRATKQSAKFVVGRRKNLGLHLNDSAVSERHAEVVWGGDGYVLRDLGSSNGTYRNGEVVGAGVDVELRDQDVLRFGLDTVVRVEILPAMPADAEALTVEQFLEAEMHMMMQRVKRRGEVMCELLRNEVATKLSEQPVA